jgi:hypothetical protein
MRDPPGSRWLSVATLLFISLSAFTFLPACGTKPEAETALPVLPYGWKRYQGNQHGYSVVYPANWVTDENLVGGITQFSEPRTAVNFGEGR